MGSGGTIVLANPPPSPTAVNDLFSSGHYTDFGVALRVSTQENPESALQTLDPALTDLSTATHPQPSSSSVIQATSVDPQHDAISSVGTTALHVGDTIL
jgi:hypothetical protein